MGRCRSNQREEHVKKVRLASPRNKRFVAVIASLTHRIALHTCSGSPESRMLRFQGLNMQARTFASAVDRSDISDHF